MQSEIQHLLKTVKFVHHLFHKAKAGMIQSARAEARATSWHRPDAVARRN